MAPVFIYCKDGGQVRIGLEHLSYSKGNAPSEVEQSDSIRDCFQSRPAYKICFVKKKYVFIEHVLFGKNCFSSDFSLYLSPSSTYFQLCCSKVPLRIHHGLGDFVRARIL